MSSVFSPSRRSRAIFLVTILLSLSYVTSALAHLLTNPSFGTHPSPGCSAIGWTVIATGSASAMALTESAAGTGGPANNCIGRVRAWLPGPSVGVLRQDFHVPSVAGAVWLTMDVYLDSAGGPPTAQAQFVGVFRNDGTAICSDWANQTATGWGVYSCDVSAEKGHDISLRVRAHASTEESTPSTRVHIDEVDLSAVNPCPISQLSHDGPATLQRAAHLFDGRGIEDLTGNGNWCWGN